MEGAATFRPVRPLSRVLLSFHASRLNLNKILAVPLRKPVKTCAKEGEQAAQNGRKNHRGRNGLATAAPSFNCAAKFLRLPGSICTQHRTPPSGVQGDCSRSIVESCAQL
jgi:hypothetical protein